jgi:hypothetical protein
VEEHLLPNSIYVGRILHLIVIEGLLSQKRCRQKDLRYLQDRVAGAGPEQDWPTSFPDEMTIKKPIAPKKPKDLRSKIEGTPVGQEHKICGYVQVDVGDSRIMLIPKPLIVTS